MTPLKDISFQGCSLESFPNCNGCIVSCKAYYEALENVAIAAGDVVELREKIKHCGADVWVAIERMARATQVAQDIRKREAMQQVP